MRESAGRAVVQSKAEASYKPVVDVRAQKRGSEVAWCVAMGSDVRGAVRRAGDVRARKRGSSIVMLKVMASHGLVADVCARKRGSEVAWCVAMGGEVQAAV